MAVDRHFWAPRHPWSDGKFVCKNESQAGLSFRAMKAAAADDAAIAARVKLFQFRVEEELYDFEKDPNALQNLAGDPAYREIVKKMREQMIGILAKTGDPDLPLFRR